MPQLVPLIYTGTRDHDMIADDLGLLLQGIKKGTITKDTDKAYFGGYEFVGTAIKQRGEDCYFLKKDLPDLAMLRGKAAFKGAVRGTTGRVFVKFDSANQMVADFAGVWNHGEKVWLLDAGFFKRARG